MHLFSAIGISSIASGVIFLFAESLTTPQIALSPWLLLSILIMAAGTLFNQYYRGLAYRCSRPSTLMPFLYFSVFVSALFDWLVFKNIPNILTIIGGCLIILGGVVKIYLRSLILKKRRK